MEESTADPESMTSIVNELKFQQLLIIMQILTMFYPRQFKKKQLHSVVFQEL